MPSHAHTSAVQHDARSHRFLTTVDGVEAGVDYEQRGDVMHIIHTAVPPQIGGRGVAGQLVRAALEHARANDLKVVPACSYVATYLKRHPQYNDLIAN